jgi:tRNA wybutosine-synthesizing protein 2
MLLRVERAKAEAALRRLRALGIQDCGRRIRRGKDSVDIPVVSRPPPGLGELVGGETPFAGLGELVEGETDPLGRQIPPYERAVTSARIPPGLKRLLPDKWERLGRVLVLRLPKRLQEHKTEIARAYAGALEVETVLEDTSGSRGVMREPTTELLLGTETETIHIENYVRYSFDAARIMFSSGNMAERIRMGKAVGPGETVVDMFAGIGYFSLQMAVHGRPRAVFACELNPSSYHFLVQNVRLNKVGRVVVPLEGDCRKVAPEGVADRVVMGHFDSPEFISKALRVLRPEGGMLHVHCLCRKDRIPDAAWERVRKKLEEGGRRGELVHCERVKSFKPRTWHIVLDVKVE